MKKMSKLMYVAAASLLVGGIASCGESPLVPLTPETAKVAMVTDYGDITDESFNQATYEGCEEFCSANSIDFTYVKPASNSDAHRIESIEQAIDQGHNVIVMPGYAFAPAIKAVANNYPSVYFIALDVGEGDFGDWTIPENVYSAVYQEELAGYMAGYAAVKEGYTNLAFLGGMSVPAVVRYGYGFVQGCDDAADGKSITITYAYGNQFFGDADIKARTDVWCQSGVEVIFSCGGGIYTSACESAQTSGTKIIGVDVDQSKTINDAYGDGMCITSAMKGLAATVKAKLKSTIIDQKWTSSIETLGLVSGTDPESNYVQLPTATWSMKNFSVSDYKDLVKKLYDGSITVSNDTSKEPTVASSTKVTYQGNIK